MHQRLNKIRNHLKTLRSAAIILVLRWQNNLMYWLQNILFIADIISNMWLCKNFRYGKVEQNAVPNSTKRRHTLRYDAPRHESLCNSIYLLGTNFLTSHYPSMAMCFVCSTALASFFGTDSFKIPSSYFA